MRAGALVAVLALAGAVAGCVLVTGGSDGYSASQANLPGLSCHTPADCNGQLCCFELDDAGTPSAACQASCPAWEQSCAVASDCGDAGACLAQSCSVEGITATVTTCGAISFCTQ
jgi:hypothetical protein